MLYLCPNFLLQRRDLSMIARRPEAGIPGVAAPEAVVLDELAISLDNRGAVVRRVPLSPLGQPLAQEARCLISTLTAPIGSGLARLVSLLERVEDLKHVLLWGPPASLGGRHAYEISARLAQCAPRASLC